MRQASFITGFNNWGKTSIIQDLFGGRLRYLQGWKYRISDVNFNTEFTVETHSNDDYSGQNWVDIIQERIDNSDNNGENIFVALCPSLEAGNNFITLLSQPTFANYDRLNIFLIEYKWEHHAKLIIENIINSAKHIQNINFIVINADKNLTNDNDRYNAKIDQIKNILNTLY